MIVRLQDTSRYAEISGYFTQGIIAFGAGRISPLIGVGDYLLSFGRSALVITPAQLGTLLLLGLMMGSYFAFYIISPYDLHWHLSTSFDRLLLQLWPTLTFSVGCTGISKEHS